MEITEEELKKLIITLEDTPKPKIRYRDTTEIRRNPLAFQKTIRSIANLYRDKGIQYVIGKEVESLIWASAVAHELGAGLIAMRRKGNPMGEVLSAEYEFEYGEASLSINKNIIPKGSRVLVIDYALATGGTMKAMLKLLGELGANIVGVFCLINLKYLAHKEDRKWLDERYKIDSFVFYEE